MNIRMEILEFAVPDEFKSWLGDVFNGMFIDGGLEVNEENLATAELIKKALFVEEYLPKDIGSTRQGNGSPPKGRT